MALAVLTRPVTALLAVLVRPVTVAPGVFAIVWVGLAWVLLAVLPPLDGAWLAGGEPTAGVPGTEPPGRAPAIVPDGGVTAASEPVPAGEPGLAGEPGPASEWGPEWAATLAAPPPGLPPPG